MKIATINFILHIYTFFSFATAKLLWTVLIKDKNNIKIAGSPGAREGHAAVAVGTLVYSFGGSNLEGEFFNDLHVFHSTTRSWSKIISSGDSPVIRKGASLTFSQNDFYLFGGINNQGSLNDVYKFDRERNQWLCGEPIRNFRPVPRSGHAAATDGSGQIYIFGGYNTEGIYLNDLWVLDSNLDVEYINEDAFPVAFRIIKSKGSLPPARESASLTYVDGKLYLFGGYGPSGIQPNDIYVYDIKKNEWKHILSINAPNPREGHAGIRSGRNVIIVGGCDITRGVNRCYNDIWNLNTETFQWTLLSNNNEKFSPREGHTATFVAGGRAIIYGGSKRGNYVFSDILEVSGFDMCGDTELRCSGHGSCFEIGCSCDIGYGNHDCGEFLTCPNKCHGNGVCLKGVCLCFPGYIGPSCFSTTLCPGSGLNGDCNGNGICSSENKCFCKPGFFGKACEFHTEDEIEKAIIVTPIESKQITGHEEVKKHYIKNYYDSLIKKIEKMLPGVKHEREAERLASHEILSIGPTVTHNTGKLIYKYNFPGFTQDYIANKESEAASEALRIFMGFVSICTGSAVIAGMIFVNDKRRSR